MKKTNYFLILLLVFTAFTVVSCSKSEGTDDGDKTEDQNVPQSKAEAEGKIEGKWHVSGSADVNSVEFLSDGTYILEVSAGSDLLPAAGTGHGRNFVSRSGGQRAALVAQTGASGTVSTTGTYTVSADGKTITLDQIATITITNLTEANFSFSITFTEGNKTVAVSLEVAPTVAASDKTNLLARTWGYRDWPSTYEPQDIAELTAAGFKLQDMKFVFTKSGTFIMSSIGEDYDESSHEYFYYIRNDFGYWEWKDSQQNTILIIFQGIAEPVELEIIDLTANSLKFSPGMGDNETADLVPLP